MSELSLWQQQGERDGRIPPSRGDLAARRGGGRRRGHRLRVCAQVGSRSGSVGGRARGARGGGRRQRPKRRICLDRHRPGIRHADRAGRTRDRRRPAPADRGGDERDAEVWRARPAPPPRCAHRQRVARRRATRSMHSTRAVTRHVRRRHPLPDRLDARARSDAALVSPAAVVEADGALLPARNGCARSPAPPQPAARPSTSTRP